MKEVDGYSELDKETSELKVKLREIRRDSLAFEKTLCELFNLKRKWE
ncbi:MULTISPECIES: hypothetical protein [Bacillus subtilis group]|nr:MULTISPECIES: hypothetical protein [Bacillus subtilis group]QGI43742.1 hypothetical protein GII88_11535 [Bacillus licheniformis]